MVNYKKYISVNTNKNKLINMIQRSKQFSSLIFILQKEKKKNVI